MNPELATKGATELLDKGLLGLIVLALSSVVVILWRYSNSLQGQIAALNEKRAEEAKALALKTAEGLANSSVASAAQASAIDKHNTLLQQLLDLVRGMPGQHEMLAKMLDRNRDKIEDMTEVVRTAVAEIGRGGRP